MQLPQSTLNRLPPPQIIEATCFEKGHLFRRKARTNRALRRTCPRPLELES